MEFSFAIWTLVKVCNKGYFESKHKVPMICFFPSWYIFHCCKNLCSSCLLLLLLCFYKGSILKKMSSACLLPAPVILRLVVPSCITENSSISKNMPNNVNTFKQKFQWYVSSLADTSSTAITCVLAFYCQTKEEYSENEALLAFFQLQ